MLSPRPENANAIPAAVSHPLRLPRTRIPKAMSEELPLHSQGLWSRHTQGAPTPRSRRTPLEAGNESQCKMETQEARRTYAMRVPALWQNGRRAAIRTSTTEQIHSAQQVIRSIWCGDGQLDRDAREDQLSTTVIVATRRRS